MSRLVGLSSNCRLEHPELILPRAQASSNLVHPSMRIYYGLESQLEMEETANSEVSSGLVVLGKLSLKNNHMKVLGPALMLTENLLWLPGIEVLELVGRWFTINPYDDKNWENTNLPQWVILTCNYLALNSYHNLSKIMKNRSSTLMARARLEPKEPDPPGAKPI